MSTSIITMQGFIGGFLIEAFLAICLYGISLAQAYVYWFQRRRDPLLIQRGVLLVMVMETIHSVLLLHATYHHTILLSGDLSREVTIIWSAAVCVVLGVFVTATVQIFFIKRIWILTQRNVILTMIPSVFCVLRAGIGFSTGAFAFVLDTWLEFRTETGARVVLESGLTFSAIADMLIAAILIHRLHKSRTGMKETDHILQRLMIYAIHTGAITTICSFLVIVLFACFKDSLAFAGLAFMTSKLYINSLLGTLNAREILRKSIVTPLSSEEFRNRLHHASTLPRIEIYQETLKENDSEGSRTLRPNSVELVNEYRSKRQTTQLSGVYEVDVGIAI